MQLEYVPLLKVQRELYAMPRSMERFQAYLETMVDAETRDLKLPLVAMNPMGKDHIPKLLDEYLAFDGDGLAAQAVAEAAAEFAHLSGQFKVTLVLSDDLMGGWTNRYTSEFSHRFQPQAYFKRGWFVGMLWTSEPPTPITIREEVLTTLYRGVNMQSFGFPVTLSEMLAQEGQAMARAGCTAPVLEADDLAYTKEVVAPYLDTKDYPTIMVCLFGDEAAQALGYAPLGLSRRAGLALALHNARIERLINQPI
jgi:hypothetical protein